MDTTISKARFAGGVLAVAVLARASVVVMNLVLFFWLQPRSLVTSSYEGSAEQYEVVTKRGGVVVARRGAIAEDLEH